MLLTLLPELHLIPLSLTLSDVQVYPFFIFWGSLDLSRFVGTYNKTLLRTTLRKVWNSNIPFRYCATNILLIPFHHGEGYVPAIFILYGDALT